MLIRLTIRKCPIEKVVSFSGDIVTAQINSYVAKKLKLEYNHIVSKRSQKCSQLYF